MEDFARRSLDGFLDQVADRTPTPGGGGVTAMAGALACALGRMVAAYSVGKKTEAGVREKVERVATHLHRADQLLRALITRDAVAYAEMTAAASRNHAGLSKRKGLQEGATPDSEAVITYKQAVAAAVAVPLEVAAVASNALSAMDELKDVASRFLLSDLGIAAVLADATVRAVRYTVAVNAAEMGDVATRAARLKEIDAMVEHATALCRSIEGFVRERLNADRTASR